MKEKDINKVYSKLLTLRTQTVQMLDEVDEILKSASPTTGKPRQRQNKRAVRMLSFDAQYKRKK